jgi:hypothetical protein
VKLLKFDFFRTKTACFDFFVLFFVEHTVTSDKALHASGLEERGEKTCTFPVMSLTGPKKNNN